MDLGKLLFLTQLQNSSSRAFQFKVNKRRIVLGRLRFRLRFGLIWRRRFILQAAPGNGSQDSEPDIGRRGRTCRSDNGRLPRRRPGRPREAFSRFRRSGD